MAARNQKEEKGVAGLHGHRDSVTQDEKALEIWCTAMCEELTT